MWRLPCSWDSDGVLPLQKDQHLHHHKMIQQNRIISYRSLLVSLSISLTTLVSSTSFAADLAPGLYAKITTKHGAIIGKLYYEKTPLTVTNFVGLAEGKIKNKHKQAGEPYYDGLTFHRVIPGFMIQGGCPQGTGTGDPGYKFKDEILAELKHDKPGIFSMANSGPGTNGSQFFITEKATPWLDKKHTVFGEVVEGMDVVKKIIGAPKGAQDKPNEPQIMQKVEIVRVGSDAEGFKADQGTFDKLKNADKKEFMEQLEKLKADGKTTESGIKYLVLKKGSGSDKPKKGQQVSAHYVGTLTDGTKFDSSRDRGQPLAFPVGTGRVIKGWDETLLDMVKGERRLIMLPPELAYGSRGAGRTIPPNATLVFDVELVDFK
ncbi:MAG: peptidylprolyl isomerase [Verrucomicrobiota bacterium]